jgi:Ca-activated chloride channel family protein
MIADYGIRVHTIGVGTLYGGVANVDGWPPIHAEFAEDLLQEIAQVTRGEYFLARNADKVKTIYEKLGRRVTLERREHEVTSLVAAMGMIASLASVALSLFGPLAPRAAGKTPRQTS